MAFTTDAIQTRVNTLGTCDVWDNGDQVKIERTIKYDSDYYTYTVSVVENGTPIWTLDKKLYWNGEEEHIHAAFYPAAGTEELKAFKCVNQFLFSNRLKPKYYGRDRRNPEPKYMAGS